MIYHKTCKLTINYMCFAAYFLFSQHFGQNIDTHVWGQHHIVFHLPVGKGVLRLQGDLSQILQYHCQDAVFRPKACRCRNIKISKKVKFTLEQAVKSQKGSRSITYFLFNLGNRQGVWSMSCRTHFTLGKIKQSQDIIF